MLAVPLSPNYTNFHPPDSNISTSQKFGEEQQVVAIPKSNKPPRDPKTHRPISLLCIPFKIMKRLIYT